MPGWESRKGSKRPEGHDEEEDGVPRLWLESLSPVDSYCSLCGRPVFNGGFSLGKWEPLIALSIPCLLFSPNSLGRGGTNGFYVYPVFLCCYKRKQLSLSSELILVPAPFCSCLPRILRIFLRFGMANKLPGAIPFDYIYRLVGLDCSVGECMSSTTSPASSEIEIEIEFELPERQESWQVCALQDCRPVWF